MQDKQMATEFGGLRSNQFQAHIPLRWSGRLEMPRVL